jgi:catechol 2,3-dioxygenase-like lactoylglutathione lyase family enzyme
MATRKKNPTTRKVPRTKGAARAPELEFNHAMIYTQDLGRALAFYRDRLGFRVVDDYPGAYARLRSPKGRTSIALHCLEPGMRLDPSVQGVRLYFEAASLDALCKRLAKAGVAFDQPPRDMPWGWRHAYLRDPDGHELSLFDARGGRLRRTVMRDEEH